MPQKYSILILDSNEESCYSFKNTHSETFRITCVTDYASLIREIDTYKAGFDLVLIDMYSKRNNASDEDLKTVEEKLKVFNDLRKEIRDIHMPKVWDADGMIHAFELEKHLDYKGNKLPIAIYSRYGARFSTSYDIFRIQEKHIYWAWKHKDTNSMIGQDEKCTEQSSLLQIIEADKIRKKKLDEKWELVFGRQRIINVLRVAALILLIVFLVLGTYTCTKYANTSDANDIAKGLMVEAISSIISVVFSVALFLYTIRLKKKTDDIYKNILSELNEYPTNFC